MTEHELQRRRRENRCLGCNFVVTTIDPDTGFTKPFCPQCEASGKFRARTRAHPKAAQRQRDEGVKNLDRLMAGAPLFDEETKS